jgi:MFS family permease
LLKDLPKEENCDSVNSDFPGEQSHTQKVTVAGSLKNLFGSGSYLILLVYNAMIGMTFWIIYSWLPSYLKEHFKLGLGKAGISATLFIQLASLLGVIIGGTMADRWSVNNKRGRLFIPVIGFTLGCPFLFLMASTNVLGIAILSLIVFGLARGFHDSNLMPVMCQVIDRKYRATGYGFLNFTSTIIGGLMVYAGGALMDANVSLSLIFQVSATALLVSSWLLLAVKPKYVS